MSYNDVMFISHKTKRIIVDFIVLNEGCRLYRILNISAIFSQIFYNLISDKSIVNNSLMIISKML